MNKLAIHGGEPACSEPADLEAARSLRFGQEETRALEQVVDSGVMCRTFGARAEAYEKQAAEYFAMPHAVASSSGTAAIHTALAAVGVGWGDEVITSPITDMGTIIAATNPLAVDVYASSLAPWNNRSVLARSVKHLAIAAGLGLGEIDAKKLAVVKADV